MLQRISGLSVRVMERWLPDPFVLCLILTLFVFGAGIAIEGESPIAMVQHWGAGFWTLLTFAMQMVLLMVTGCVVASTPFFKRVLRGIARLARTPAQAIILATVVSMVASWINGGFGLVLGALFARQMAQVVTSVDYRLLIASAYSGFIVWHAGLGGSIPLVIATPDHFLSEMLGVIGADRTVFAAYNLLIVLALLVVLPLLNRCMMPGPRETVTIPAGLIAEDDPVAGGTIKTPADRLENSVLLAQVVGAMGLGFIFYYFASGLGGLTFDIFNFAFLFIGLMLHGRPSAFVNAVNGAIKGISGIVIQYPFYAGIMGMVMGSGLATSLSELFVNISTAATLPLFAFVSAGIVNIFIPSGGGPWAVQAPIIMPVALEIGADVPRTAMAIAWGDAWTNLIQPFWALPALALAGLRAKDIIGFCLFALLVTGCVIGLGLIFLP